MPIFLFNYSTRELHGIYRAKTDGTWMLNPAGGCHEPGCKTPGSGRDILLKRACTCLTQ